uniref:relA-associated inhibitor isoform X2 n=1 Tax=Pristiophorus japonicus TaxID=55135 RepID=UPI00398F18A5
MLVSVLLEQLFINGGRPHSCNRMADEHLEASPLPFGNGFAPVLEYRSNHLFHCEQRKLNEATFELDRLSQELESLRSMPSGPTADHAQQDAKSYRKDGSVGMPAMPNSRGLSKSESASKYDRLAPPVNVGRSLHPQPAQAYTPLSPPPRPSLLYDFNPMPPLMPYQSEEQHAQPDRAPSPRPMIPGPPILCSPRGQYDQPDRAPSPRPMILGPPILCSPQGQYAQPDRAPSPRPMILGPPILCSPQGQYAQPDRAPSPRPMILGPPILCSPQGQYDQPDRAPSPRPMIPGTPILCSPQGQYDQPDRAPSPRPMIPGTPILCSPQGQYAQPDRAPSPRPMIPGTPILCSPQGQYDQPDRAPSPRPMILGPPILCSPQGQYAQPDRAPSPRPMIPGPPSHYMGPCYPMDPFPGIGPHGHAQLHPSPCLWAPEHSKTPWDAEDGSPGGRPKARNPGAFNVAAGDTLKNKKAAGVWAEADLDIAYEKKVSQTPSYENTCKLRWNATKQGGSWRQTDLDLAVLPNKAAGGKNKKLESIQIYATLPGTRLPPRRLDATLPTQSRPTSLGSPQAPWPTLPAPLLARAHSPRASPIKERRNVLPLSVLIRPTIVGSRGRLPAYPGTPAPPGHSPLPTASRGPQSQHAADVGRRVTDSSPQSADGRFPALPIPPAPETEEVEPEIAAIFRTGEAADAESHKAGEPRPLSPTRLQPLSLPDSEAIQDMEELLRIRAAIPRALKKRGSIDTPTAQLLLPTQKRARLYQQVTNFFTRRHQELAEEPAARPSSPQTSPDSESDLAPDLLTPRVESPTSQPTSPLKRSILKRDGVPASGTKMRARLDPLVLLLDAALLGELDVVQRVVYEMNDPSQSNAEGITGLHNAVCGGHYNVVEFLVNFGVNVNAPDSYGWTPLHCAASCNDLPICTLLMRKGAAIFSMTLTDGDTAAEKCDRYLDGYEECARFLFSAEQQAGMMNNAVVYGLWDHKAESSDELSFRDGETITILRRGDRDEGNWWWASLYGREGYVPYNYLGLFPRVRPLV